MNHAHLLTEAPVTDGLTFRTAHADDLPKRVHMLADDALGCGREPAADPVESGYAKAFAAIHSDPNNELVVPVIEDTIVGMLQITFIPYLTYRGRWRALVEGIRVSSKTRCKGIGGAMLRWAIERAHSSICVMVQRTTDRALGDALRFHEREGFVASHHGMKLHL